MGNTAATGTGKSPLESSVGGASSKSSGSTAPGSDGKSLKKPEFDSPLPLDVIFVIKSFLQLKTIVRLSLATKGFSAVCLQQISRIDAETSFGSQQLPDARVCSILRSLAPKLTSLRRLIGFETKYEQDEIQRLLASIIERNTKTLEQLGVVATPPLAPIIAKSMPKLHTLRLKNDHGLKDILKKVNIKTTPQLRSFSLLPEDFRHPIDESSWKFNEIMEMLPLTQLEEVSIAGIGRPTQHYKLPAKVTNLRHISIVYPRDLQDKIYRQARFPADIIFVFNALTQMLGSPELSLTANMQATEASEFFTELHSYNLWDAFACASIDSSVLETLLSTVKSRETFRIRLSRRGFPYYVLSQLETLMKLPEFDFWHNRQLIPQSLGYGNLTFAEAYATSLISEGLENEGIAQDALACCFDDKFGVPCVNLVSSTLAHFIHDKRNERIFPRLFSQELMEAFCVDINQRNSRGETALFGVYKRAVPYLAKAGLDPCISNNEGLTALDIIIKEWKQSKYFDELIETILAEFGPRDGMISSSASAVCFVRKAFEYLCDSSDLSYCDSPLLGLLRFVSAEDFLNGFKASLPCNCWSDKNKAAARLFELFEPTQPRRASMKAPRYLVEELTQKLPKVLTSGPIDDLLATIRGFSHPA